MNKLFFAFGAISFFAGANSAFSSDSFHIISENSNLCLDVASSSLALGTATVQQTCSASSKSQDWQLNEIAEGEYQIINSNSGMCLDVRGVSNVQGVIIQQYTCKGASQRNQLWKMVPQGSNFQLVSVFSGKCIDVSGVSKAPNAAIHQWTCIGPQQENQIWKVADVAPTISADFFGMEQNNWARGLKASGPWPTLPFKTMRLTDAPAFWGTMNPSKGVYNFSPLDSVIAASKTHGNDMLYTFIGTPSWTLANNIKISSIVRKNGVVTVTVATPTNFYYDALAINGNNGNYAVISGVSDASLNGTFPITGVSNGTKTFTFAQTGKPDSSSAKNGVAGTSCNSNSLAKPNCAEPFADIQNFDLYVTALVNHVGPGVIKYWEMWNEVNVGDAFWKGSPALMAEMTEHANKIIKKVDPNAIILSPSVTSLSTDVVQCQANVPYANPRCGSNWLSAYLKAGALPYIDAIAYHGYALGYIGHGNSSKILDQVNVLREAAIAPNSASNLPLIDTEASFGDDSSLTDAQSAAWLASHYLYELSLGVEKSFWYTYNNSTFGTLYEMSTGKYTEAGIAYENVQKWIVGSTLTGCTFATTGSRMQVCTITRANGYSGQIVWTSLTNNSYSYALPKGATHSHDLSGSTRSLSGGSVSITGAPLLLDNSAE